MADNVDITPGSGAQIATDDIGGVQYQRVKVTFGVDGTATDVSSSNPLPVSIPGTVPVSGTFFQATQPVSLASLPALATGGNVIGAVAQSGAWNVNISNASIPVTGTFWQATQPVSIAATVAVSGPLTDTQLRATAVPVSLASTTIVGSVAVTGTFWQATQPVSLAALPALIAGSAIIGKVGIDQTTPGTTNLVQVGGSLPAGTNAIGTTLGPTLTKGTQGSTGYSVQHLHDAGRSCLAMTAEFTFAQTAETLLTMTLSVDGAATSTFGSRVITNGKKFRIQSVSGTIESLGSGTAPQRAYLRLRRNTAGATVAASPLQAVWAFVNATAVVKSGFSMDYEVPDALEMNGDGTATFGFTLETPDWVTSTATGRIKITVIGFEY